MITKKFIILNLSRVGNYCDRSSRAYSHSGWMVKWRWIGRCGRVKSAMVLETGPGCLKDGRWCHVWNSSFRLRVHGVSSRKWRSLSGVCLLLFSVTEATGFPLKCENRYVCHMDESNSISAEH